MQQAQALMDEKEGVLKVGGEKGRERGGLRYRVFDGIVRWCIMDNDFAIVCLLLLNIIWH